MKIHIRRQRRNERRRQWTLFIIPRIYRLIYFYHWNLYRRLTMPGFYQRYRRGIGINLND